MKLEQAVDVLSVPVTGARSPPGSQLQLQWSPHPPHQHQVLFQSQGCCIAVQDSSECVELVSPEVAASQSGTGVGGVDVQPRLWKGSSETNSTCFLGGALWDWSCSPCGTQLGNICLQTSFLPYLPLNPHSCFLNLTPQISRLLSKSRPRLSSRGSQS